VVEPPMPDKSKSRCQTRISRLGLGVGLTTPPGKNVLLRNHGGGQDPYRVVAPVTKKKNI
jgi:hypothetical protein